MIKAIVIIAILIGLLDYALLVASSTADKDAHEAYERWKKRKYDNRYKHGAMCDTEDARKVRRKDRQ